jgi:hypothetical protein
MNTDVLGFFVFSGSPLFGQSAAGRWIPLVEHDLFSHIELLCPILVFSGGVPITQTNFIIRAASRVHAFCNLQSWARTHAVLVICLFDLLDPTT